MSKLTLDEAIKVLRQHNEKGASVLRITRGQALEKDLLSQVLDSCEQLISENAEYKRLLKSAIDEWNFVCEWSDCGEYCSWFKNGKCTQEWSGKAEALKLIGENGDT